MNGKHRKTLAEVFDPRCQASIDWLRIEALLLAKEAKPYQVADARDFLQTLGIRP